MRSKIDCTCADSEMEEIEEAIVSTNESIVEDSWSSGGDVIDTASTRTGSCVRRGGRVSVQSRGGGSRESGEVERTEICLRTTCGDLKREKGVRDQQSETDTFPIVPVFIVRGEVLWDPFSWTGRMKDQNLRCRTPEVQKTSARPL
jgi:hypothetical protein